MVQTARAINSGPTFQRFLPPTSTVFLGRVAGVNKHLSASLLQPHLKFAETARRRDWRQIINGIMKLDFEGITAMRDLNEIISEIDAKTEGQALDEAFAVMRELHREIRKQELPHDFSLLGFLKAPPLEEIPDSEINFDPAEILIRTFGVVDNIIEMGKKYKLPDKYWGKLEDRFEKGCIFLRAAKIFSRKI